jgi:hypothetical protein
VVGADQRVVGKLAQGEPGAAVNAEIAPGENLLAGTPQHQVLAEQAGGENGRCLQLAGVGYRMPVVDQNRIINHASSCAAGAVEYQPVSLDYPMSSPRGAR